jgi:tetratricopeptide (TPR) repeat protein
VTWQLHQARADLAQGDISAALARLESAEYWQSDRTETQFLLARACRRAGQIDRAAAYLERASQRGWPEKEIVRERHLAVVQSGRSDRSRAVLDSILLNGATDELAEEFYEAQAKGLILTYRLNEAVVCLNFWIAWRPAAIKPRMWLADIWERCDRWQSAADVYQSVVNIDRRRYDAHLKLADNLLHLNDVQGALGHYETCLQNDRAEGAALLGAARCRRRLGMPDQAAHELEQLLQQRLTSVQRADALVELAQLALDARRPEQALARLERALELEPRHSMVHSTLALVYARQGRTDLVERHQREADEIKRQFNRLTEITGMLIESPGDADLRFEAGSILMQQGLKEAGAEWMSTALIFDSGHQPTHRMLAEYFAQAGDAARSAQHRQMLTAGETGAGRPSPRSSLVPQE